MPTARPAQPICAGRTFEFVYLYCSTIIVTMERVLATSPSTAVTRPVVDPRLVASLAAVYIIWSSTYLAIRIAVQDLPPMLLASIRFIAAGSLMLGFAIRRGARWPTAREWLRMLPIGMLLFIGGNGFVAYAERSVSSGGVAVVCATMPLWVGILGAVTGTRPTGREWLSLVIGFIGVLVLMDGPSLSGRPIDVAFAICSPILWAAGSVLARKVGSVGGPQAAIVGPAMQMLTGGAMLAIVGLSIGERIPMHAATSAWLAVAYLFAFGSVIGFTAYAWLLRNTRPVVATSYAFVNPVLAVLIGAALYGEPLGWTTLLANVLIVGAIVLALTRRRG